MRRALFLAGLALAVGAVVPGSALPAAGGSDLPLKGSFSGATVHNLPTGPTRLTSRSCSTTPRAAARGASPTRGRPSRSRLYFHRVALVNGISYGEHDATLDGQLSW